MAPKKRNCLDNGLKLCLTIIFLGLFGRSCYRLASNKIGTRIYEEKMTQYSFPPITLCPWRYNPYTVPALNMSGNITIKDIRSLPRIQDTVNILMDKNKATYGNE